MATYISENPIIIRQFFCLKYWPWMELGIWTSRSDPSLTSPLQSALFQENLKLENIILILSNMQFCLNLESRNSLKVVYRKLYDVTIQGSRLGWFTGFKDTPTICFLAVMWSEGIIESFCHIWCHFWSFPVAMTSFQKNQKISNFAIIDFWVIFSK